MIGCIGFLGLIHHEIKRGSFNKESAKAWIEVCLRKANEIYGTQVLLVIDNAPYHSTVEDVLLNHEFIVHEIL